MIRNLSNRIIHISNKWVVLAFLVIMMLFIAFVLPKQAKSSLENIGSAQSPDTSFFYTPTDLFLLAEDYGAEGRQAYIHNRWTFDLIFPIVYVGFLASGISWFLKDKKSGTWTLLNLFPVTAGFFDYLENSATSIVMASYPNKLDILAYLSSGFTLIKWLLVYGSFLIYFLSLFLYLYAHIKAKRGK